MRWENPNRRGPHQRKSQRKTDANPRKIRIRRESKAKRRGLRVVKARRNREEDQVHQKTPLNRTRPLLSERNIRRVRRRETKIHPDLPLSQRSLISLRNQRKVKADTLLRIKARTRRANLRVRSRVYPMTKSSRFWMKKMSRLLSGLKTMQSWSSSWIKKTKTSSIS